MKREVSVTSLDVALLLAQSHLLQLRLEGLGSELPRHRVMPAEGREHRASLLGLAGEPVDVLSDPAGLSSDVCVVSAGVGASVDELLPELGEGTG